MQRPATWRTELAQMLRRVETAYPKASLMYARLVTALLDAPGRTMSVADLSDAVGKGRDSTAVQDAVARLETIGLIRRDLHPADRTSGRSHHVELLRPAATREPALTSQSRQA